MAIDKRTFGATADSTVVSLLTRRSELEYPTQLSSNSFNVCNAALCSRSIILHMVRGHMVHDTTRLGLLHYEDAEMVVSYSQTDKFALKIRGSTECGLTPWMGEARIIVCIEICR